MMKRFFVVSSLVLFCISISAFNHKNDSPRRFGKTAAVKTVIIDPGHGGLYPGAHGLISTEKDVTLEIALRLGDALQKAFPDIKVLYTRTTDACSGGATNLRDDLHNRAKIANDSKGDLFISIHCNATPQPAGSYYMKRVVGHRKKVIMVGKGKKKHKKTVSEPIYESYLVKNTRIGTETYVWKAAKQGEKLNAINNNDETGEVIEDSTAEASAFDIHSPENVIRTQLYEKRFFQNSAYLASLVEDEFKASGRISYGVKQRDVGIQVLQATGMPSILVETGFLTNKEEEEYLNSEKGQDEVVNCIALAFGKYKQSIETNKNGKPSAGGK